MEQLRPKAHQGVKRLPIPSPLYYLRPGVFSPRDSQHLRQCLAPAVRSLSAFLPAGESCAHGASGRYQGLVSGSATDYVGQVAPPGELGTAPPPGLLASAGSGRESPRTRPGKVSNCVQHTGEREPTARSTRWRKHHERLGHKAHGWPLEKPRGAENSGGSLSNTILLLQAG